MKAKGKKLLDVFLAVVLAFGLFFCGHWVAEKALNSTLLAQSRVFRSIVKEDSIDFMAIIKNKDSLKTLEKFIGAVSNAYVSFELIPINEGETFVVVMGSLSEDVKIDGFSYQGRDLMIEGTVTEKSHYITFIERLKATDHFEDVILETSFVGENRIKFCIRCQAKEVGFPTIFEE